MTDKTPEEVCESLLGLTIESIEINTQDEFILFTLDNGQEIEFTGDDLEMYISSVMSDS
jgi:hypothetical protein